MYKMTFWNFLTLCGIWVISYLFDSMAFAIVGTFMFFAFLVPDEDSDIEDEINEFDITENNSTFGTEFPDPELVNVGHIHFLQETNGVKVFKLNCYDQWDHLGDSEYSNKG